ncbi:MAG: AsmA-like C-terminal domain-containing protein, partial [Pseudomonadota bacterium]
SFLRGRILPKFIEIDGATVEIERREEDIAVDGSFDIADLLRLANMISEVRGSGFQGAVLNDFTFAYTDVAAGSRFRATGGTASLHATNDDYDFAMRVPFGDGEIPSALNLTASTRASHGAFTAQLEFDRAPMAELLEVFFADDGRLAFDVPVSGTIDAAGSLEAGLSNLMIDLDIGQGVLKVRDRDVPIMALDLEAEHNVLNRTLIINALDFDAAGVSGELAGEVSYQTSERGMSGISLDLTGKGLALTMPSLFEDVLPVEALALSGAYDVASRSFTVSALEAAYFDTVISGTAGLNMTEEGQSPGITANLSVYGDLSVQEVMRGWPVPAADGARRWVVANMPEAKVSNVTFEMDVPPGGMSSAGLSDEALIDLNFRAEDATVIYTPGMTPITGLAATGRILGNTFTVEAEEGRIGSVKITDGDIDMPRLVPKGGPAIFTILFEGEVADILGVVDEEPLGYISEAGFDPAGFGGTGQFTFSITRPLLDYVPIENYRFNGAGTFRGVTFEPFGATLPLEEGSGTVALTEKGMTVTGLANASGIPASFEWTRPFGDDITQELEAEAEINSRTADAMGLPLRRFMRGNIVTRIKAMGGTGGFEQIDLSADLAGATLFLENGNVIKPEATPGEASLILRMPKDIPVIGVENIKVSVPGANIEGNARFTGEGGLIDVDLPRLWIDGLADMSMRITRNDRRVKLSVTGEYADASGLIDTLLAGGSGEGGRQDRLPGGIDMDIGLARVDLKGEATLLGVDVQGHYNGAEMARLTGTGSFDGGGMIEVELQENGRGLGEDLMLRTDSFGSLLNGLFGISSVQGGEASMKATLIDEGPIAGEISATNITLKDAPIVAQLLSIGSLDGLANVLNGEGLEFTDLKGDLQLQNGELRLVDARLTGSALGLSANGTVNLEANTFGLHGAVAPAYRVNSLIGGVPIVGDIFVSREGEGVFAFAYRVDGPMSDATVQVNTLAALTPGIFRRVFEPVGDETPTTAELLSAAEEAAGDQDARDFLSTPELLREYEREEAARSQSERSQ